MTTSYHKGRAFEYQVATYLRRRGFTVTRAAGSHSPYDLIAYDRKRCLHVQCKLRITLKAARAILKHVHDHPENCVILIATKRKGRIVLLSCTPIPELSLP